MAYFGFRMDEAAVIKSLKAQLPKRPEVVQKATMLTRRMFDRAHRLMMNEFRGHAITQELKSGNTASNDSGTLQGHGNLFAFLGFIAGTDPTKELEELLSKVDVEHTLVRYGIIYFRITDFPSETQIRLATRMEWGKRTSWAYAVETGDFQGDAALSHFIFKSWEGKGARSLMGLQVKGYEYTDDEFQPQKYISLILSNFQDRINNANSKYLM